MKCIYNIDWLELYCCEPPQGLTIERLKEQGYKVKLADYSTRVYKEVLFVSNEFDQSLFTICRDPASEKGVVRGGLLPYGSCHIKVQNWVLYTPNFVTSVIKFLNEFNLTFKSISRLDVCCDLQHFADYTKPLNLINGFFSGRYYKIGQRKFHEFGTDKGDDFAVHGEDVGYLEHQSISFGSRSSNVYSKMYNKSLELKQVGDKPYIREQWHVAGLDINQDIWRVEISIKGKGKTMFDRNSGEIRELNLFSINTPQKVAELFIALANHYFVWKVAQPGKRRYDCPDKKLFDEKVTDVVLHPLPIVHESKSNKTDKMVVSYLLKQLDDTDTFDAQERAQLLNTLRILLTEKRQLHRGNAGVFFLPTMSDIDKNPSNNDDKSLVEHISTHDTFNIY